MSLPVPPELFEALAERAAAIVLERLNAEPEPWLSVEQAAAYLACEPARIYSLKSAGRIPHRKDGSRLLFRRSELDEWLAKGGATRP